MSKIPGGRTLSRLPCGTDPPEHNNSPAEQAIRELKDRYRHRSGFSSDASARDLLRGWFVHVNVVNTHDPTGYASTAPSIRPSGDTLYHGRITKEGACLLRWGLVHAVRAPLFHGGDTSPMRFPGRIAAKRGKAKAAAATARKLLQVVHWTLREGEPYHGAGRQPMQLSCG